MRMIAQEIGNSSASAILITSACVSMSAIFFSGGGSAKATLSAGVVLRSKDQIDRPLQPVLDPTRDLGVAS